MSKLREEEFYYQYEKNGGAIEMPKEVFWELYEDSKELENIIDKLEKWLYDELNHIEYGRTYKRYIQVVIDKLKELKTNNML